MTTATRRFDHRLITVFDALSDPLTYPEWLLGAKEIRAIDPTWPAPGSTFHHRVGLVGPLTLADSSSVVDIKAPNLLVLEVRARPFGRARVTFRLQASGPARRGGVLRGADRLRPGPGAGRRTPGDRPQHALARQPRAVPRPRGRPAMSGDAGVLLDVDGTLVDTNHLHVLAWSRAFRRAGRPIPMHRIHERIGMGGDRLVADLLGEDAPQAGDVTEAWAEEFHHLWPEVRLLPGAKQLVRALHLRRQRVVLASSAPADDVARFRALLDVDDWLAGATSSDDAEGSKPDPDIFEVAMDRFGLDPSATVAVGDAVWDARAAERAGIGFIGVETGGTDRRVLSEEGALRVVRDAADLTRLVEDAGIDVLRSR